MLIALQGAVSQGVLWGIMVLGVFITFRLLDIPEDRKSTRLNSSHCG